MSYAIHQHGPLITIERVSAPHPTLATIPAGVYTIEFHPVGGYCLAQTEPFTLPERVYGKPGVYVKRFLSSFRIGTGNLGVILWGRKGSGKTLTLKLLCAQAIALGLPVLLAKEAYQGVAFNDFLASIHQPCVLAIDEFDKKYLATLEERSTNQSPSSQSTILDLLQGLVSGKKLVVLTCNKLTGLSEFLLNRPGRVRYVVPHEGIDVEGIADYAREHLGAEATPDNINDLIAISRKAEDFNFDMLQAIVEEMQRFQEDAFTAAALMLSKFTAKAAGFVVEVWQGDRRLIEDRFTGPAMGVRFFSRRFKLGEDTPPLVISESDLTERNLLTGTYVFKKDGYTVRIFEIKNPHEVVTTLRRPSDLTPQERRYRELEAEHGLLEGMSGGETVSVEEKKKQKRDNKQYLAEASYGYDGSF